MKVRFNMHDKYQQAEKKKPKKKNWLNTTIVKEEGKQLTNFQLNKERLEDLEQYHYKEQEKYLWARMTEEEREAKREERRKVFQSVAVEFVY